MKKKYKKADLEELISLQLENLNGVHDLVSIMRYQNDLLEQVNGSFKTEVLRFNQQIKKKKNDV